MKTNDKRNTSSRTTKEVEEILKLHNVDLKPKHHGDGRTFSVKSKSKKTRSAIRTAGFLIIRQKPQIPLMLVHKDSVFKTW